MPFRTAKVFCVTDIIAPSETRQLLCDWIEQAWTREQRCLPITPMATTLLTINFNRVRGVVGNV